MAQATAMPPPKIETQLPLQRGRWGKIGLIVAGILLILFVLALAFCRKPFSRTAILEDLHEVSDSQVEVRAFHQKMFPYPGCVLEGVVFRHGSPQNKPIITIDRLTIRGSYSGILQNRVSRVTAEGMHIFVPEFGTSEALHTTPATISVDEIVANGATVEFAYHEADKPPLRFEVQEAVLRNVIPERPFDYRLRVHNPEPPGEVAVEGKFGNWKRGDAGETPISGEYTFEHADLSVYHGIAGILSSKGKFEGKLAHIDIDGKTDIPDFEVKMGGHPTRLSTEFSAYVDAIHGDTYLKQVTADFWKTHLVAEGSVAKSADGKGKTALINFRSSNARIDDLLHLFAQSSRAPMSGKVTLRARVEIPPGEEEFLKKLKLRGSFGIESGKFSESSTQEGVNKLSAGARGEKDPADPETVLTDLTGQVNLARGTSTFSDLSFGVPSASARMHGTYDLLDHKIDLRGQMQVDTKISNTENGPKAVLLKAMEPFFKKKKKGEIVPVRISGTYEHPTYGLDLRDKKAQDVPDPKQGK
jgi:hypothetical protein